jgi:hypothetical protein
MLRPIRPLVPTLLADAIDDFIKHPASIRRAPSTSFANGLERLKERQRARAGSPSWRLLIEPAAICAPACVRI